MKNQNKKLIYLLLISFLSGCASGYRGYKITYNTEPKGASVICNGINEGYSPIKLNYSPDDDAKRNGTFTTVPCTAIWSSGVRQNFNNKWDLDEYPNGVITTLQRPSTDGYSQDANFALQIQNIQYQKRQAEAAEDAAKAARRAANATEERNTKRTTCFTNLGTTICL